MKFFYSSSDINRKTMVTWRRPRPCSEKYLCVHSA